MFDVSLKGVLKLYLSHFFRMKKSLDGVAKIRAYIVLYTWRLLNLLYTNTHIREWGKVKREWGIFKREWDVCEKFHVVEVFLIYLQIISRASRCLKHSCFRSCHCHIQLNYNAYSSCGLKMFLLFVRRKGGWGFLFLADAFAMTRRTKKLGKVTKQKQSTRQNWITKNLDASIFYQPCFLKYCKLLFH